MYASCHSVLVEIRDPHRCDTLAAHGNAQFDHLAALDEIGPVLSESFPYAKDLRPQARPDQVGGDFRQREGNRWIHGRNLVSHGALYARHGLHFFELPAALEDRLDSRASEEPIAAPRSAPPMTDHARSKR